MVGNATEEGLLRDLKNPAHRDRPVWPLALALAMLGGGWWIMDLLMARGMPVWAQVLIAAAFVALAGVGAAMLIRAWTGKPGSSAAEAGVDARAGRQADLARRIAAARARGDFDRWEARSDKQG